ncbi:integrase catalytic domain-containing protein [Trichonephila clavipes]|nr:integrase catalytic domain-containing protein [Trichonephila clavipes]
MFKSDVKVTLVRAKARVAPLKPLSIPRLELMACCIGSRLANSIVNALNLPNSRITFWSDSTTALWWIKEKGSWWWEGPLWLRESPEYWPLGETPGDSEEVELERKKLKVWKKLELQKILWKFIPPTAAWWGDWWERLVRTVKELLKRTLGRSVLKYDELYTVLCDCESIINCRPLTYGSENPEELIPLTPSMFLISNKNSNIEDIEELNSNSLNKRIKYRSKLLKDLRQRFRNEYLSQLIQKHNEKESRDPQIGEVFLVGDDNKKRLFWALAKIIELIPGRDGKIRTVRLKTQHGKMLRPIQRIYPLEIRSNEKIFKGVWRNQFPLYLKLCHPMSSLAEIVEVEIEVVSPSIGVSPSLNRTVTCMVLKANDRRTSCPCHDEFRGPRSDYVRQVALSHNNNINIIEFVTWKEEENKTMSKYVRQRGSKIRREKLIPSYASVLCSDHFEEECLEYQNFTNLRHLKSGSVPTNFVFTKSLSFQRILENSLERCKPSTSTEICEPPVSNEEI